MVMPNKHGSDNQYRYGFQGQEKDDEVKGEPGNSINYKYRMHDPRVGRFFAVDPLADKYPQWSPYAFSGNQVIHTVELEGLEPDFDANEGVNKGSVHNAENKETGAWSQWTSSPVGDDIYEWIETGIMDENDGSMISDNPDEYYLNQALKSLEAATEVLAELFEREEITFKSGKWYGLDLKYKEPADVGINGTPFSIGYSWVTIGYKDEKIEAAGLTGGAGRGFSLFHQAHAESIYFHQTMTGKGLLDVFDETTNINVASGGGMLIYDYMRGYDSDGQLLWTAHLYGSMFGGTISEGQGKAEFEYVK